MKKRSSDDTGGADEFKTRRGDKRRKRIIEEEEEEEEEVVEIEAPSGGSSSNDTKEEKRTAITTRSLSSVTVERLEAARVLQSFSTGDSFSSSSSSSLTHPSRKPAREKRAQKRRIHPHELVPGYIYQVRYQNDANKWVRGYVQVVNPNKTDKEAEVAWLYQKEEIVQVWVDRSGRSEGNIRQWLTDVVGMKSRDYCFSNHRGNVQFTFFLERVADAHFPIYFVVDIWKYRVTPIIQSTEEETRRLQQPDLFIETSTTLHLGDFDSPSGEESKEEKKREEEEDEYVGGEISDAIRAVSGSREMLPEMREFRDSLCADERRYFQTTEGLRVLSILKPMLNFGNSGRVNQVMNDLVYRFFFGTAASPRLMERAVVITTIPREKGRCGLCDCTPRVLSAHIRFPGLDDIEYRAGSECVRKLKYATALLQAISEARRWFVSSEREADRPHYVQLEQHYKTITDLSRPRFARASS